MINLKKLNKTRNKEDLKILNQILTNNELNEQDKKNMFEIAYYIMGKRTGYYIHEKDIIKLFNDFCQNNKNRQCFSEILTYMKYEIERLEYLLKKDDKPKRDSDDKVQKPTIYELDKELTGRLYTTLEVALSISDFDHDNFYEIIKMLLNSKMEFGQNKIIPELVKDEILRNQKEKLKIAIDVALNADIQAHIGNGWDIIPYILNVITDKDILNFDNNTYRKVVELSMHYLQAYVLDNALKHEELTPNKKLALIEYFDYMMKKYLEEYWCVPKDTVQGHAESIIFKVAYSKRLLSMHDATYEETLQKIKNCNKPFSYAEIEANDKLTDEQKEFVSNLIENGVVHEFKPTPKQNKPSGDYKQDLARAAISPNALNLPIELYKKVLTLMDLLCQKTEDLEQEQEKKEYYNRNYNEYWKFRNKQKSILKLLNNEMMFNNIERLITTIEKINSNNITGKVIEFCEHEASIYYTDSEYQKAIDLIKRADERHCSYEVLRLFTNKNIPFMEDKSILFRTASSSEEYIDSLTERLNDEGTYNMNMYFIFNGVDKETIENVTDNPLINIKKLIKEQKAND